MDQRNQNWHLDQWTYGRGQSLPTAHLIHGHCNSNC